MYNKLIKDSSHVLLSVSRLLDRIKQEQRKSRNFYAPHNFLSKLVMALKCSSNVLLSGSRSVDRIKQEESKSTNFYAPHNFLSKNSDGPKRH